MLLHVGVCVLGFSISQGSLTWMSCLPILSPIIIEQKEWPTVSRPWVTVSRTYNRQGVIEGGDYFARIKIVIKKEKEEGANDQI